MADEKQDKLKTTFVFEIRNYKDNNGRHVIEKIPVFGEEDKPEGFCRFVAPWQIKEMTPIGPAICQFEVPLPRAKSAFQAFEQMAEEAEITVPQETAKMQKNVADQLEAAKRKIALVSELPSGLPPPPGPGGRAIPGPGFFPGSG